MWITRPAIAAMLVAATSMPALAHPIEIVTLGRAPLMGQSTSPQELKYNFKHNEAIMRRAAAAIGLTREQYDQFRLQLDVARPNWVTIPRHLDAMTWAAYGQVHVLHDVIIPPNQKGAEVDLQAPGKNIALFLPAKCGNLSVIRTPVRHVANVVRNFPVPHVAAIAPPPRPVAAIPPPAPAPVVAAAPPPAAIVPAAIHHSAGLWPLAALIPFIVGTSNSTHTVTPSVGTIVGPPGPMCTCPPPPPCP
jgi:hypothetical protein